MITIHGHFDGKVLVPDGPVNLPPNQPLVMHVAVASTSSGEDAPTAPGALEKHAASLDEPADWSTEHDHYLYGTPKRGERDAR